MTPQLPISEVPPEQLSYTAALAELENIVNALETNQQTLENSLNCSSEARP